MQSSRRSTRSLHSLLAATVLLTVQNTWLFTAPAQADRVDSGGDFICGVPGKDGVGSLSGIINTYYPGAAGTTVAAGSASVPVGTINVAGSTTPISAGDLLLVIQMQDADIDSTDTAAYGNGVGGDVASPTTTTAPAPTAASGVTNLNNSGRYEYVVATGPAVGGAVPKRGRNGHNTSAGLSSCAGTTIFDGHNQRHPHHLGPVEWHIGRCGRAGCGPTINL
jgi:hypothetical protein